MRLVEEATGLRSRWNGTVRIIDAPTAALISTTPFLAKKEWSCGITIVETTLNSEGRWRSLLHEALHSVSVGLTEPDYHRFRLWEEAVVEMLQRLYRPVLFRRLGLAIAENQFRTAEENWRYNLAIGALTQIAAERPDVPLRAFLEEMLRTSLPNRPAYAFEWGASGRRLRQIQKKFMPPQAVCYESDKGEHAMSDNTHRSIEDEWQFEFPPEVQAERQLVLDAYDRAMNEGTLEAIKRAGTLGWDWVARYPKDYVVWDAGEPLSMLADAIEATSSEAAPADKQALSASR